MKHYYILVLFSIFSVGLLHAQDDLLDELEDEAVPQTFESPAFKAMKIGNLQSTKVAAKGDFYLYVSHRFGTLDDGLSTFFGFDNANTKIQLVYGLLDGWQFGISRESLRQTYALSTKMKLKNQSDSFPVNLVGYATVNINTQVRKDRFPFLTFDDRLSYTTQLLVSRRFSNSFSLELAPSYVRQNLTLEAAQKHDQFAMGAGGRLKVSKRMSINMDYVYNFSRADNSQFKNPLTIGVDIETGGHVFQLLFSNAQSTNEPGFISNAEGDWGDGDIFFGFNIVRVF
ncbi:hypothetical protein H2O64_18060 [Kordia sp. YSTF-M3]|uniref:DUF5777 domain-containing protein n=1 Tax=Kordia aestuariivivens TaxID=2759037 RepID=A0ABR7QDE8_9FLAO|nr:DUF5777 family beta-barrel protein [Kordia aestuariivivens]MBC8756582.1 hypothetical protein [Kordia aestuariivivens]